MNTNIASLPSSARVLVTGGAGFIGSHLVEHLVGCGSKVAVVDNLSQGRRENLAPVLDRVDLRVGDMGDLLKRGELQVERYDYIFHLAANSYIPPSVEDPAFDYRANLENTFLLLDAIRRTAVPVRLVNTSTAGVYGDPARIPIHEEDVTVPISPYGVSKLAGERYAAVYARLYGVRVNSLRLFSVFGPRQKKQVVFDFLAKLKANPAELEVLGDGTHERDFVYATDVVQAMILAATVAPGQGEVYNVASGRTITIADLATLVCRLRGGQPRIHFTGKARPGDAVKWVVDIARLKALGYRPQMALEAGLSAVVAWFDGLAEP